MGHLADPLATEAGGPDRSTAATGAVVAAVVAAGAGAGAVAGAAAAVVEVEAVSGKARPELGHSGEPGYCTERPGPDEGRSAEMAAD